MPESASYFRTVELSDMPVESGILKFMTVKSPAMWSRGDLSLYVPKQAIGLSDVPVVILLHGVYGSHWIWSLKGNAHLALQSMIDSEDIPPFILAMPSDGLWGDGSAYINHSGKQFEDWITKDVPMAVHEATGNALDASHFIAGLSMGGYGAMRLGAKYPDRFVSFSGHSSITALGQMKLFVEESFQDYESFGNLKLIEQIMENRSRLNRFRFDCGVDDLLIGHNRVLHQQLKQAGIFHHYDEFSGAHEWPYWQNHITDTYRFFADFV